jgi:RNA polymerase sigma-70 factor (ECF subfamily)
VLPIKDNYKTPDTPENYGGHNIIVAVRQGDPEAIAKLYDQYSGVLFGFINRIVGNSVIAEGVLQNSFVVIWKNMAIYDPKKERILTWMLKITMNIAINALPETGIISNVNTGTSDCEYLNNTISLIFFKGLSLEDAAKKLEIPMEVLIPRMKMAFKQLYGGLAS